MVARITTGTSIEGVLRYNEKKLEQSVATLIYAGGFPRDAAHLSLKNKLAVFNKLTSQNIRTKTNTMHVTLNFSPKDRLNKEKLTQIARDYMVGIGFGQQPVLVYQHFDAAHPHIHIATVTIADGGKRIPTHNIGVKLSSKVRREIESTYGLIKVEQAQQQEQIRKEKGIQPPVRLERVIYGKVGTREAIFSIVGEVVKTYKFCSLPELNAVLNQFGVVVDGGRPGSRMHTNGGLIYALLDENNKRIGSAINSSLIEGKPTLKNLQKRYKVNIASRRPYGQRLRHLLDKAISATDSKQGLEQMLHKQGIRVIFNKNAQGEMLGVHYIDNATRVVYNGEDLGAKYEATPFFAAISKKTDKQIDFNPPGNAGQQPSVGRKGPGNGARAEMDTEMDEELVVGEADLSEQRKENERERAGDRDRDKVASESESTLSNPVRLPGSELPVIQTFMSSHLYDEERESSGQAAEKKQSRKMSRNLNQQLGL